MLTTLILVFNKGNIQDELNNLSHSIKAITHLQEVAFSFEKNKISDVNFLNTMLKDQKYLSKVMLDFGQNNINNLQSIKSTFESSQETLKEIRVQFPDNPQDIVKTVPQFLNQFDYSVIDRIYLKFSVFGCDGEWINVNENQYITFPDNNECKIQNCSQVCDRCINENNECLSCSESSLTINLDNKQECISYEDCREKEGYYCNKSDKDCSKCIQDCSECINGITCNECNFGFYVNTNKQCKQCKIENCEDCNGPSNCTKCENDMLLIEVQDDEASCIKECPSQQYYQNKDKCFKCIDHCEECTNGISCDVCDDDTVRQPVIQKNMYLCLKQCQPNYYEEKKQCLKCMEGCSKCQNKTECEECGDQVYMDKDIEGNQICLPCQDKSCKQCQSKDKGRTCQQCMGDLFLYTQENQCVTKCPQYYYDSEDSEGIKICEKCYSNCSLCTDGEQCERCQQNYYLNQDLQTCKIDCQSNYYKYTDDRDMKLCLQCNDNCQECQGDAKTCTKCLSNEYLNNKQCFACSKTCATCDGGSVKDCQTCKGNDLLQQKQCVKTCSQGFIQQGKTCVKENQMSDWWIYVILAVLIVILLITLFCLYQKKNRKENEALKQRLVEDNLSLQDTSELKDKEVNKIQNNQNYVQYRSEAPSQIVTNNLIQNQINPTTTDQDIENNNKYPVYEKKYKTKYHEFDLISKGRFQQLYERKCHLGEGAFAVVEKYYDKQEQIDVAIKKFKYINNERIFEEGLKEALFLKTLNKYTDYVIELKTFFIIESGHNDNAKKKLVLVFELAEFTLHDLDLSSAMNVLHYNLKMAHRDLKPRNILFKDVWKLADLGGAKIVEEVTKFATNKHSLVGTLTYLAPEQKLNYIAGRIKKRDQEPYNTFKADAFTFGLMCYEVITLLSLEGLNEDEELLQQSIKQNLLTAPNLPLELLLAISKMLQWEPKNRISFQELDQILKKLSKNM